MPSSNKPFSPSRKRIWVKAKSQAAIRDRRNSYFADEEGLDGGLG